MAARRLEAGPERAGDRRRLPARHDEDLHRLRAELGLRQRPRLPVVPGRRPRPRWVSGVVKGPLRAARVAGRELGRSDHAPLLRRRTSTCTVDTPDDFLTGTSRDTTPEQGTLHLEREIELVPGVGAAAGRRPHRGARLVDLGLRPLPGPRREDGVPSVPRDLGDPSSRRRVADARRAATPRATSSSRPIRRPRASRPSARTGTKGSDQFKACSHAAATGGASTGRIAFALCAPGPRPAGDHLAITRRRQGQQR